VAEPVRQLRVVQREEPSLDPGAIERAYHRERARRRARYAHENAARSSSARYWVMIAFLLLLIVVIGLTTWHQVQATFGI
jgi:predicted anti-sigma-YlaC factor YlaD